MGQCASNKAKGNLSVKKILSQKKLKKKKMDKNKQSKDSEDIKSHPMSSEDKKPQKYTKGTAMSFGFKRRPTPMITSTSTVAWESDSTRSDPNGNKDDLPASRPNSTKTLMHKTTPTSSQKHISSITPKPSRFNFSQTNAERTNKVADIKNVPLQLSATPNRTGNKRDTEPELVQNRTSPNSDLNRAFSRNVTIITRTQVTETSSRTTNEAQTGKFMFQTTRLPQPEPIRVIETKTAKTIANNNRRSARMWRQYEEATKPLYDDSGFGNCSASGGVENRLQDCNRLAFLENSDSFSDACTPPPLPELPSVFDIEKQDNDNKEEIKSPYAICKKSFLKSSPNAFLKNRRRDMLDSPQSSSDQEWLYGGEAMADDLSLRSLSPKIKSHQEEPPKPAKSGSMADSLLMETILKPAKSLEMIDSLKESMNLSLCVEDANFSALVTNTVALLDDEILSPVESLLSSSETDELVKNKNNSSSNSKDVNEKLTPPGSPSQATYSLSDDKEDFLIDDEIADQPELIFEEGNNPNRNLEDSASISQRQTSDFSPLPSKKQRNLMQRGSFDSLSPCESIDSEDLMCDYEVSQNNDVWEGQSGSYTSLEGTPKTKFKLDDSPFNSKYFFKKHSLTPKHSNSPSSLKMGYKSSPEHRSPKRSHFGYQSAMYDSSQESLALTKANHAAMQHDIIGIRTMLMTLKRVLNESESHSYCTEESFSFNSNHNINNNNNEFKLELADLRRQVIFLQGQLEDKEKTVTHLQRQIGDLAIQNTHTDNSPLLAVDIQNRCNAATQTEKARPVSGGMFSLTTTPIEDNNPILRYMVK